MSNIVIIGDLMLDKYSYGSVKRLNPESPNTLLNIDHEEYKLGGAANVAANMASLTGTAELIGILGKDYYGRKFTSLCQEGNINLTSFDIGSPTITKQRFIDITYKQQLLRVDYEKKHIITEAYNEKILTVLNILHPQYIVLSDYNKGIISQELVDGIKLYAKNNKAKILVDTKPEHIKLFKGVYLIKPNFNEFCRMINKIPGEDIKNTDEDIERYGVGFVKKYKTNLVVTRSSQGASFITKEGSVVHLPTQAQQVFDVTGAGDTFLAAITVALQQGKSLEEVVAYGNKASGIVVGKVGTATVTKDELYL